LPRKCHPAFLKSLLLLIQVCIHSWRSIVIAPLIGTSYRFDSCVLADLMTPCSAKADGTAARPINTRCFFEISIDGKVVAPPNDEPFSLICF
jgi:hypothetical protein